MYAYTYTHIIIDIYLGYIGIYILIHVDLGTSNRPRIAHCDPPDPPPADAQQSMPGASDKGMVRDPL